MASEWLALVLGQRGVSFLFGSALWIFLENLPFQADVGSPPFLE